MKLNNRILRELKENWVRYLGLFVLTFMSVMVIVGFSSSTDNIIHSVEKSKRENKLEDGHFNVYKKLDEDKFREIEALGFELKEEHYIDYKLNNGKTIRLFKNRSKMNLISLIDGENVSSDSDIVLDEHFGELNSYLIGNKISIEKTDFVVRGYGITPDYTLIVPEVSDMLTDHYKFGIGFISEEAFDKLDKSHIINSYAFLYRDKNISNDEKKNVIKNLQEKLKENNIVTGFYKTENNKRATFYKEKLTLNKNISIMLGSVLIVMLAFIISISVTHIIERESAVIGTFYSLGFVSREIIRHFMIIPLAIVSSAATLGTALGFTEISKYVGGTSIAYFNFPNIEIVFSSYLIFIGLILPILITFIVNRISLTKKLNLPPLKLLRKDIKREKLSYIKIKGFKFLTKFRLRVFLREIRNYVTLLIGICFSVFLLIMGFGIKDSLGDYAGNVRNSIKNEYMYYLKSPVEFRNDAAEKAVEVRVEMKLKKKNSYMNVTIQGIEENSKYYDLRIPNSEKGVYVSNTVSKKFNVKKGDTIEVNNPTEDKTYSLKIVDVYDYINGLYIFMNRQQLNELVGNETDYFNLILSENKLDIPEEKVYKYLTADEVVETANNMVLMMKRMIAMLIVSSVAVSVISLYLILKIIIDRSQNNISLIKIFGFNNREINKMYLGTSLLIVIIGSILSIPICQTMFSAIWPGLISSIQGYIFMKIKWMTYVYTILIVLFTYLISDILLKRHLKKIELAEVLKNRE